MSLVPEIRKVGIVGLGLMGHGIAQVAAQRGFTVVGVESSAAALDRGVAMMNRSLDLFGKKEKATLGCEPEVYKQQVLSRFTPSTDKGILADCDIVVEAVIEDMGIKSKLYRELGSICKPSTILASNTSSFEIGFMSEPSGRKDRLVGMHFFNPVQLMKLVEVVRTPHTSQSSFDIAYRFGKALGKEAVECKDTPGFIVNRLLVPYMVQAIAMLERGEASVKDIDAAMRFGAGYPMGPFKLLDFTGLDTMLYIMQGWTKNYPSEPAFFVPTLLATMVAEGKLGRKSGQGFYTWVNDKIVE